MPMRSLDPQVAKMLESLSRMTGKTLMLGDFDTESDSCVVARSAPGVPRIAIRDVDDAPFSDDERTFLRDVLGFIRDELLLKSEHQALEQRLRILERENVDLSLKNRALTDLSSRDALTGLYTRWYLLEKIEAEMNRALRHGSSMSLLMIDIDHFKHINDSYGHAAGDHVLQAVGQVLRDSCRIYDVPGRYGGEEFCLMLPETRLDRTLPVAERIRARVEESPVAIAASSLQVTVSIGIAGLESVPEEALFGAGSLLERADRALYAAKDRGRNRIELWSASLASRPATAVEH